MANAKKCDSCGTLYEETQNDDYQKIAIVLRYNKNEKYDLCKKCYRQLCRFVHAEEQAE